MLARIQFAFTIGYHFLFVPISLGLGLMMVFTERGYYKSGLDVDKSATTFWLRLFTATFAIGVATGITMEFAFGTNWASFSRLVGDIFGAPLAAEGIFSFFLESTFLGVLLFGRNRVSKRFYYVSTWLVAVGAHLSALWIITLFGIVDPAGKTVRAQIAIPNLLSLMLGFSPDHVVTGLDKIPLNEQPPLQSTFQTYHFMVLLGLYFVALMVVGLFLLWRKRLDTTRWYLRALVVSIPLPIIAMQLGWMAAEIGRQPWIVQDILRTRDAISATVPAGQILTSLIIFGLIYALLFAGWLHVVLGAIRKGPEVTAGSAADAVPAAAVPSTGTPAPAE